MTGSYIVLLICLNRVYALHWPVHYTQYKRALARTTPWLILALCLLPYLVFEPAVLVFRHHHNYTTGIIPKLYHNYTTIIPQLYNR